MLKKIIFIILVLGILAGGFWVAQPYLNIPTAINTIEPSGDAASFEAAFTFDPDPNGFSFRNFTGRFKEGDLTIEEVQNMFGDSVCTRLENDVCIPHPKVVTWIGEMNQIMNSGGHCVGFTVASNQLYTDTALLTQFGADKTYSLERELPVLKMISQGFASNYAGNVQAQEVKGTPSEIVEALLLLDEPVDLGIFFPAYGQNGHSILAHNVIDQGNGIYHIVVYDSNRPGEDNIIVVDTRKDTWFYADAAINPDQPSGDYHGDAKTQSLSFFPLSAYNQPLTCPSNFAELCPADANSSPSSTVTLVGRGSALVSTSNGEKIGQDGDDLVNTVSDARLVPIRNELYSHQQPIILLPATEAFTLQIQGKEQIYTPLSVSVANPSFSVVINNLIGLSGQIDQLNFDPINHQVEFIAAGPQRPLIQLVSEQNGVVVTTQLSGLAFDVGQGLTLVADLATGNLQIRGTGLEDGQNAVLLVARLSSEGEAVFASAELAIPASGVQILNLDAWDGSSPLSLSVDGAEVTLPNQPMADVLPAIDTTANTIKSLQNIVPYLDNSQIADAANTLPTLDFSGGDLGNTYLLLPALQPADLAGALATLPVDELAPFVIARGFKPDETAALLDDINLTSEEKEAVEADIADQRRVDEVLDEWEFRNADDLDSLDDFIEEQGLTDDQAGVFGKKLFGELLASVPPTETPTPVATATNTPTPPTATKVPIPNDPLANACSINSDTPTDITFVNQTSSDIKIFWVNYECNEQALSVTLAPGESYTEPTFTTHPWRVRTLGGEQLLLMVDGEVYLTYQNGNSSGVTANVIAP
jgi:hypothetical protein